MKNENRIVTETWSNISSKIMFDSRWREDERCRIMCEQGYQCGSCSFFAPFNADWGLCCNEESRHFLETIFEHFTCPSHVNEGWGPHGFSKDDQDHCRCGGERQEP